MTQTESALIDIWKTVLGRENVAPTDDFFALGGNSLMALRVGMLVKERLGVEAPVARLFQDRTLSAFAQCIDETASADVEEGVI